MRFCGKANITNHKKSSGIVTAVPPLYVSFKHHTYMSEQHKTSKTDVAFHVQKLHLRQSCCV